MAYISEGRNTDDHRVVDNYWTGTVDWNDGLEWWTGMVEWNVVQVESPNLNVTSHRL